MSHQMMRQRPPTEEDLQQTADEERRRLGQTPEGTKQTPTGLQPAHSTESLSASHAEPLSSAGRSSYFVGPYAPAMPVTPQVERKKAQAIVDGLLSEFSLPDSLRESVLDLIKVMREHGIGAAQAALHSDESIDRKYVHSILRLLAAAARNDSRLAL